VPNTSSGAEFKEELLRYIESWGEDIEVLQEKPVGWRYVGTPRKLDIILRHGSRYLGIEAKYQASQGTADQKLIYTLEDAKASPIPVLVVFAGRGIKQDIRAKLISSGIGLELGYLPDRLSGQRIQDNHQLFRQRVYIELGLNWFKLFQQ